MTDLIADVPGTTALDRREALEAIDAETDRLNALIANLLDMSRIEAGTLRARPQTVDLAEAIAESVDRLRHQRNDIGVDVRIVPEAQLVRADPVFLDRIMSNLLENAANATVDGEPTRFEVDVRRSNSLVVVRVVDHGPGVPQAAREQLGPLSPDGRPQPSSGIRIGSRDLQRVRYAARRRHLDRGHAGRRGDLLVHAPARLWRDGQLRKERILVVDDEAQIRKALNRALVARNYEVEVAVDGEEALTIAEGFAPDLVVLDLNLPGIDGFDVCRRFRTWSSAPVIVLSVREDESDKVEALDIGADDYLTKPFGIEELLARIRALLRRAEDRSVEIPPRFSSDGLEIDLAERRIARDGKTVRLTKTEWALLEAFAGHPGKLLTHRWLLTRVWGEGYADDLEVLRVFVSQLRKKIEREPTHPTIIVTEPGVGYRWVLHAAASQRRLTRYDANSNRGFTMRT